MILSSSRIGSLGGLDTDRSPLIPGDSFLRLRGVHFNEQGSLTRWKGFTKNVQGQIMGLLNESGIPAVFTGLFPYLKSSGARHVIGTARDVYKQDPTNVWAVIKSGQTGTKNDLYDAIQYNDRLFICNGVDPNLYYDGTSVFGMGIAAPTVASVATLNGIGVLTGTYSYRVAFLNAAGDESNMGPVSNGLVTTLNGLLLSNIPASTDPQVTARRIYRTTANGAVYLQVADIADNTTTTFSDNNGDGVLGIRGVTFSFGIPPPALFFVMHRGHLFMAKKNGTEVLFSAPGKPTVFHPNDVRDLDRFDGITITGGVVISGILVIFKSNSIWNIGGEDRTNFAFTKQVHSIGAMNHHGIVKIPGKPVVAFPSEDGFYMYDTVRETVISDPISPEYRKLNQGRLPNIVGVPYKKPNNMILWLASSGGSPVHDTLVVWDYFQNKWAMRDIPTVQSNIIKLLTDPFGNERFYLGGIDGYVRQGDDGFSDDTANIITDIVTRPFPSESNKGQFKNFYSLEFYYGPPSNAFAAASIDIYGSVTTEEGPFTKIGTIVMDKENGISALNFNLYGEMLFLRFTETSTAYPFVIRGWKLHYRETGRRIKPN